MSRHLCFLALLLGACAQSASRGPSRPTEPGQVATPTPGPALPPAPPSPAEDTRPSQSEKAAPDSRPPVVALDGGALRLRFFSRSDIDLEKPLRTTHLQQDVGDSVHFAVLAHAPSADDFRFSRHDLMLDVLFHPHDQPPGVVYLFSCPDDSARLSGTNRHEYRVDGETAKALGELVGEFAVLVLNARGEVLLRSSDPVDRSAVHRAMGYRDRVPSPADRPRRPRRRHR